MKGIKVTDDFVLFWGDWPSQWHRADFTVDGVRYNCCEQFMMAEKARAFGDDAALSQILAATNPRRQKALGRTVRGFDADVWNDVCRGIVYAGNLARFTQDDTACRELMATGERVIVEASPTDRIWGIGLDQDDPRALDPAQWRGSNWLGVALAQVRETIRARTAGREPAHEPWLARQIELRKRLPERSRP